MMTNFDANQLLKATETELLDKESVQDFLMTMKTKLFRKN